MLYYPNYSAKVLAVFLNRDIGWVYRTANGLGIKKSEAYMLKMMSRISAEFAEGGKKTRFKKGSVPHNKGKKVKPHVYEAMRPTMFKKGSTPFNHKPVGSERITRDGYIEVKVAEPRHWKLKHRLVYEAHYGAIPAGYNIQFKDGNSQNLDPNNLYAINRKQQILDNNIHRYPDELKKAMRLLGKLNKKIRKHEQQTHKH